MLRPSKPEYFVCDTRNHPRSRSTPSLIVYQPAGVIKPGFNTMWAPGEFICSELWMLKRTSWTADR